MHTICTQNAHNMHTHNTENDNMQHIHINTEQHTDTSTENSIEQTQYPDTEQTQPQHRCTDNLHTYNFDLYHEYAVINNSNTIEIYTISKENI